MLQAWQFLFLVIFGFGIIGFIRGWRREIVTLAFTFAAVLIMVLNGGVAIANVIFVRIPTAVTLKPPPDPSPQEVSIVSVISLIVLIVLGYIIGNKAFPGKVAAPAERIFGLILGIITGIAIYSVLANVINTLSSKPLTFSLSAPDQSVVGNSLFLIIVVLVVLLIIGLIASSMKKGGAKGK